MDWNDIRHFLAVARFGTTLQAAKALGANQTTTARRIAALENALDLRLFERTPAGYALTDGGRDLVTHAEAIEQAALEFERRCAERVRADRGIIRLTTSDILAEMIARPAITAFRSVAPDVHVTLDVDHRLLDLSAGEADVALRPTQSHDDPRLIVRRLLDDAWAIYCARTYPSPPANILQALAHPFATMSGKPREMLLQAPVKVDIRYSMNTMSGLMDTIAGGDCIGGLPRLAGDRDERLRYCCDVPVAPGAIWIAYPERLKGAPHIRKFIDHLVDYIAAWNAKA